LITNIVHFKNAKLLSVASALVPVIPVPIFFFEKKNTCIIIINKLKQQGQIPGEAEAL
jgi:hypothetical protein